MIPDLNSVGLATLATLPNGEKLDAKGIASKVQGMFLEMMLKTMEDSVGAEEGMTILTDRAVPAILFVNELITNAAKHAYPGGGCKIWVTLSRQSHDSVVISVRDEGIGLPPQFDQKSERLGMRLVHSFAQQLRGDLQVLRRDPGTEFVLTFPLNI